MSRIILLLPLLLTAAGQAADEPDSVTFSVTVDFGQDVGQSFGTLFEARNAAGQIVAGAGFQDVYNTHFRNDRHALQFFVKPESADNRFTVERLPHPDLQCGVYLFDLNEQIYAWTALDGGALRRWDEASQSWESEFPAGVPELSGLRSGDGMIRLGAGQLVFAQNAAWFNDRQILSPPETGGYHDWYYDQGHLYFYHRLDGVNGFTRLLACPWTPDDEDSIDVSQAIPFDTPYARETPFAWGQWRNQTITLSNMGGIYVFENDEWKMSLAPDDKTSYQVYSALHWHDRLLLAQYPSGNVFAYQGGDAVRIPEWPPVLPGVATSARECQTLSIYRGDLMAGVWPWAELWRRDHNAETWSSHGRMFTHPETSAEFQHPYEKESVDLKLVANHWGQRVTSMIPHGDSLYLSTSAKGTVPWKDDYTFLSEQQCREYGAVLKLKMRGNLAAQIQWQDRPVEFRFAIEPNRITIHQDGHLLAEGSAPENVRVDPTEISTRWGAGTFGPTSARLTDHSVSD